MGPSDEKSVTAGSVLWKIHSTTSMRPESSNIGQQPTNIHPEMHTLFTCINVMFWWSLGAVLDSGQSLRSLAMFRGRVLVECVFRHEPLGIRKAQLMNILSFDWCSSRPERFPTSGSELRLNNIRVFTIKLHELLVQYLSEIR